MRMWLAGVLAAVLVIGLPIGAEDRPDAQQKQAKEKASGYGKEEYRIIEEADEIVSVLKNGLTVIVKRVPSPVVAVRGYALTGGVYEGKWLGGGLSHLLEHLVAGGSNERRTEAQNRDILQKIGNDSNAYTSEDHTAFFINTTTPHMEEAVDLVTGWLLGASITPEEYRREYEVVQRELEKDKGEPDRVFYEMVTQNRYKVSPAKVPVIGYQEVIRGLSRDDVYNYYKMAYQPNNMIFAVSGDIDPEKMLAAVRKYVDGAAPGREFSRDIAEEPPVLAPRTMVGTFPKLGQAKLDLAFPSVKLTDPDMYALDLLSTILSSGESSLLVEEIRDKQQLVSGIGTSDNTPQYVEGSFMIDMELMPEKIAAATKAVLEQVEKLKSAGVDAERLERAKTQMRTARLKSLQTSEGIAASLATDYMSSGDPHFSDRYVERIQKVTADQVREVARKYFDRGKLLTTVLMPAEYVGAAGLPKAEDLIRPVAPTTQPKEEKPASAVTRVELPNGTVLLVKRITTTPLVSVNMYALGGLTAEDEKSNGLGNLAMEMLTRGTKTRDAQQIAEFFDSIGGDLNTGCGNNSWFWKAQFLKGDFEKAMEVYADVVNNPSFPLAELGPMKQRIVAAIESQDADWRAQAMRYFRKEYFGPMHSPYQFQAIGTKENVTGYDAAKAGEWYRQKVLAAPRVVAIFGDVDVEQAKRVAEKYLGGGPKLSSTAARSAQSGNTASSTGNGSKASMAVERVEVQKTEQPLAGIFIGFDSHSIIGEPAQATLDMADTLSSGYGYPTGYIFETLRGRGLVYEADAQNWAGVSESVPGAFFAYAGCDPKNVNQVIDLILENVARLQGTPADIQENWFGRSKQLVVTSEAMGSETASQQATVAALDELYGLGYAWHEKFAERINAVTLEAVRAVGKERLSRCVVTVSTPEPEVVKIKTGKREYESFPPVDLTPRGVQHDVGK